MRIEKKDVDTERKIDEEVKARDREMRNESEDYRKADRYTGTEGDREREKSITLVTNGQAHKRKIANEREKRDERDGEKERNRRMERKDITHEHHITSEEREIKSEGDKEQEREREIILTQIWDRRESKCECFMLNKAG